MTRMKEELNIKLAYTKKIKHFKASYRNELLDFGNHESKDIWESFTFKKSNLPNQGWKIHISINYADAVNIFSKLVPFLLANGISFKIPRNPKDYQYINNGDYGITQIGKIVTIYPAKGEHIGDLVKKLEPVLDLKSGPAIISDIRLREGSPIFFRYGVIKADTFSIDENGRKIYYIKSPQNKKQPDNRSEDGTQPDWAENLPFENLVSRNYYEHDLFDNNTDFVPISLVYKSPKGKLTLGFIRESGKLCLQKRTFRLIGADLYGNDWVTKLNNEFHVLQSVAGKVNVPVAHYINNSETFCDLYMELLDGSNLLDLERDECLALLPAAANEINRLHRQGWVHYDIKLPNFILQGDKVYLTDFELAERIGTRRKFSGETRGYAKESELETVAVSRDLYAFSICVSNLVLNFENSQLNFDINKIKKLLSFYGYDITSKVISLLTAADANSLSLERALPLLQKLERKPVADLASKKYPVKWLGQAVNDTFDLLRELLKDSGKGKIWHSVHTSNEHEITLGVNTGIAGTVLGLSLMNTNTSKNQEEMLTTGLTYLYNANLEQLPKGLYSGKAGVALALVLGGTRSGNSRFVNRGLDIFNETVSISADSSCDFFNGLAGRLYAASVAYKVTGKSFLRHHALSLYKAIVRKLVYKEGKMTWEHAGRSLTGAAHGVTGIAAALIMYGKTFAVDEAVETGIIAIQKIFEDSIEEEQRMPVHDLNQPGSRCPLFSWCHGVEGMVWSILLNDEYVHRFARELEWAASLLLEQRALGDPGICHGLSGQLELFKSLRRIPAFKEKAELRLKEVLNLLRITSIRHKGFNTWYSDEAGTVSPDLWVGFMGTHTVISTWLEGSEHSILSDKWILKTLNHKNEF